MNSTKSSRCSRHAILAVAAFSFALSSASHAQTQTPTQTLDGEYDGTLSCDPVVNHAEFESFRHAITIRVDGEDVFWTRDVDQMLETGTHYLDGSQFFLDAVGESRARPGERWRVQGTIEYANQRFNGDVALVSFDGLQRYRQCTVTARRSATTPSPARQGTTAVSQRAAATVRGRDVNTRTTVATASTAPPASATPASLDSSGRAQLSRWATVSFGTKTDDMCLDGICLEDDVGLLMDQGLVGRLAENERQVNALLHSDRDANRLVSELQKAAIRRCSDLERKRWGAQTDRLCALLNKSLLQSLNRSDMQFLRDTPLPICDLDGEFEMVKITPLGTLDVNLRIAVDGRIRVYELSKLFEVDDARDIAQLRSQLMQKHQPYLTGPSDGRVSDAPWGGTVALSQNGAPPRVKINMRAMPTRFGKSSVGACAPDRKAISVR